MRSRAPAFSFNTVTKQSIINSSDVLQETDQTKVSNQLSTYINSNVLEQLEINEELNRNFIKIATPKYMDIKKDYANKQVKPLKFHEKANLTKLELKTYEDIKESQPEIDMNKLLAMFDSEEELNEVDIENLLEINTEKLGQCKDQLLTVIEYMQNLPAETSQDQETKEHAISHLKGKIDEIMLNEKNVDNIKFNLDKVKSINYDELKTTVSFSLN